MSDSRALAHREDSAPVVRQSDNLLAQVIAAAKDPSIDADKMRTLAELVNGQQDREREIEFNQSLNAAIMDMPVITRSGEIIIPANQAKGTQARKQGRFARFEDIDRVCRPILARYNLAIRFEVGTEEGQTGAVTIRPIITHTNGYTSRGEAMRVPADTSGSKNAAQAVGSSVQYGKRYAYCAALNIVTEGVDDDGNQGRSIDVSLPFEREQVVLADATAAAQEGRYTEWFGQQPPKDRAWLISSGKHVEFGGQPQLTSGRTPPPPPPPPPPPAAATDDPPPTTGTGTQNKRTPRQLVDDFKFKLEGAADSRELLDLQAEPKVLAWMEKLERAEPQLHKELTDFAAKLYSTKVAAEREAARSGGID